MRALPWTRPGAEDNFVDPVGETLQTEIGDPLEGENELPLYTET